MLPSPIEGSNCRFKLPLPGILERSNEGKLIGARAEDLLKESLADRRGAVGKPSGVEALVCGLDKGSSLISGELSGMPSGFGCISAVAEKS